MFALKSDTIPTVRSYAEAKATWFEAQTRKWASKPPDQFPADEKPLGTHRKGYLGVFMQSDGDINFRYHDTVCVTWHPDGKATLDLTYESRSTDIFINELCPAGVKVSTTGHAPLVGLTQKPIKRISCKWGSDYCMPEERVYRTEGIVTVWSGEDVDRPPETHLSRHGHGMTGHIDPSDTHAFDTFRADRVLSRKLLQETRYAEFREWLKAWFALTGGRKVSEWQFYEQRWRDADELLAALADQSQWSKLRNIRYSESAVLSEVREAIYEGHTVRVSEKKDYAASFAQARKWLNECYR